MAPAEFYDEDDLYDGEDYEEEDGELTAEDKASMEQGTIEVKKALGDKANAVTAKQIQEALWHYYYDVDKSVAYLTKTFIAPKQSPKPTSKPMPKKGPESKLSYVSFISNKNLAARASKTTANNLDWMARWSAPKPTAFEGSVTKPCTGLLPSEFWDMPWLNVPQARQAVLVAPQLPRGGLLGGGEGAPKMSKLQALAAARKKKTEERRDSEKTSQAETGLKRLSLTDKSEKENVKHSPSPAKRQRGNEVAPKGSHSPSQHTVTTSGPTLSETSPMELHMDTDDLKIASPQPAVPNHIVPISKSAPSAFAQSLFGATDESRSNRPKFFPMPYAASSSFEASVFSEPSPDDVVFAAQAQAGKKAATTASKSAAEPTQKKPQKASGTTRDADASNGLSALKVSDAPPPKSKGLDVVKEYEKSDSKKSVSFVVVGHVDAGKSTLMGRLLLELKYVEERTVDKYRRQAEKSGKQSFALAWVMDQRSEERERGVTIDIATNHFETPTTKFTILDAPGHRDFVPNMIAGASQADFAILVIDANTGAYEKGLKGQTREHVLLLRSLGVQRLIVAVNKLDMVGWSQERFDEISQQVMGFLTGLGFQNKLVSFVPISGLNGDNIADKTTEPAVSWYKGPTLIDALEDSQPSSTRALKKPFRMSISEVFRSQQQGTTTLAGRVDAGTVQIGDAVFVQPSGESAYVKSIMVDTTTQDWAVAGQSISVALTDIDPIHIRVGDIVCAAANPVLIGDTFTMKAMAFEHLMPMPVDLHRGRLHAAGQIQSLSATLDKATGDIIKKKPKVVQPGGVARVVVKLSSKVPLEPGQRVVMRSGGETIAAGLIE